jgi:hypothetical protein
LELVLPQWFEDDGIESSQRCWVGYLPAMDLFLLGFDLWLDVAADDEEPKMEGGLLVVRLAIAGEQLTASVVSRERFPQAFYEHALGTICARHRDIIEVDLD